MLRSKDQISTTRDTVVSSPSTTSPSSLRVTLIWSVTKRTVTAPRSPCAIAATRSADTNDTSADSRVSPRASRRSISLAKRSNTSSASSGSSCALSPLAKASRMNSNALRAPSRNIAWSNPGSAIFNSVSPASSGLAGAAGSAVAAERGMGGGASPPSGAAASGERAGVSAAFSISRGTFSGGTFSGGIFSGGRSCPVRRPRTDRRRKTRNNAIIAKMRMSTKPVASMPRSTLAFFRIAPCGARGRGHCNASRRRGP